MRFTMVKTKVDSVPSKNTTQSEQTVPLIEESVQIDKVMVDRGGYRIAKQLEIEEHIVNELLQHQHCEIERRPVNRQLDDLAVPAVRYEGSTLVIPVVAEVLVTEKRLMLVEEVRITRIDGTHRDPKKVRLRKEKVVIQRLAADSPSEAKSS